MEWGLWLRVWGVELGFVFRSIECSVVVVVGAVAVGVGVHHGVVEEGDEGGSGSGPVVVGGGIDRCELARHGLKGFSRSDASVDGRREIEWQRRWWRILE